MRIAIFLLLAALSLPAHADRILQFSDALLTLTNETCTLLIDEAKGGHVVFTDERPPLAVCWMEQDGTVFVIDETGSLIGIDASAFTIGTGI